MTQVRRTVASVDDCLGPAEHRFFGNGYRRVRQRLDDIRVVGLPETTEVRAQASVRYPPDWSAKGAGAQLVPHLSSIDALVLGAQLAEILLGHAYGLDADARSRMWLREVRLRAGGRPQEDLDRLAVHGVVRPEESAHVTDGLRVTPVRSSIGSMEFWAEVQHETGSHCHTAHGETHHPSAEAVLGEPYRHHFADLFRHRSQRITDLAVDRSAGRVDATVHITPAPGEDQGLCTGLEAAYTPSTSMVDAIAVMGQLAQILLYALDGLDRADSETLWLRRATLSTRLPLRALDRAFPVHVRIEDTSRLAIAGDTWRVCDLGYDFHGITGGFSVAHRLPNRGTG
ncbi:AvrD family protein [Streptomyces fuscichromogenes]|uniref:AvrD family protein n=1 Tax=Streptomyces fuscichromogenes TaxID=1324013 RepID=UPI00380B3BC3